MTIINQKKKKKSTSGRIESAALFAQQEGCGSAGVSVISLIRTQRMSIDERSEIYCSLRLVQLKGDFITLNFVSFMTLLNS